VFRLHMDGGTPEEKGGPLWGEGYRWGPPLGVGKTGAFE